MIKCKTCGATLQIDHPYCPYCANPNPYFVKHREDMEAYKEEFYETQEEVITHTRKFTGTTVAVAIISVLVMLNLLVFGLTTQVWNISDWLEEQAVNRDYEIHKMALDQMEENQDFISLNGYYYKYCLYRSDKFEEYDVVIRAAQSYSGIYDAVMRLYEQAYSGERDYGYQLEYIADYSKRLFEATEKDDYEDPAAYDEAHMSAMYQMQEQVKVLLSSYAGLSDELLDELVTASKIELMSAVEEGMPYVEAES